MAECCQSDRDAHISESQDNIEQTLMAVLTSVLESHEMAGLSLLSSNARSGAALVWRPAAPTESSAHNILNLGMLLLCYVVQLSGEGR